MGLLLKDLKWSAWVGNNHREAQFGDKYTITEWGPAWWKEARSTGPCFTIQHGSRDIGLNDIDPATAQCILWELTTMHPRNTLYSIAWGILELPMQGPQRQVMKDACMLYAVNTGWRLQLTSSRWRTVGPPEEEWMLERLIITAADLNNYGYAYRNEFAGTLQECCLKIVEHETQHGEHPNAWELHKCQAISPPLDGSPRP